MARWLSLCLLWGCSGEPDPSSKPSSPDSGTTLECEDPAGSWESVGQPILHTWCTPCHSAQLGSDQRQGAPVGIDFDTYALTLSHKERIRARMLNDGGMPPVGGVPPQQLLDIERWLDCGAPGESTPVPEEPCENPATVVGPQSTSGELCSGGNLRIDGDLLLDADADLSCICEVTGSLTSAGAAVVELPHLTILGGDLTLTGPTIQRFEAPSLLGAGAVEITAAPALVSVVTDDIRTLTSVTVEGAPMLTRIGFAELTHVPGAILISNVPSATEISFARLLTVDGTLVVSDAPALERLLGAGSLVSVGGDLRLRHLPSLDHLDQFNALTTVGGDLELVDHGGASLHGFSRVTEIGGALTIAENEYLLSSVGFQKLVEVGGGLTVRDHRTFENWQTLEFLETIGGNLVIHNNPDLFPLPRLTALRVIEGDLLVISSGAVGPGWFEDISGRVDIQGDVQWVP